MTGRKLVLVPTNSELTLLQEFTPSAVLDDCRLAVCGFGPVASAMESASLLSGEAFDRVVLIGIAGTYDPAQFPIGTAYSNFSGVACDGVGAGTTENWLLPSQLKMPICHLVDRANGNGRDVYEYLPLTSGGTSEKKTSCLLTVCRAAGSQADVEARMSRFPDAIAEDMEGFSVTLAAQRWNVAISIIRGASNLAGDRNKANWQIGPAMQAAAERLAEQAHR